jgi:hypothetical protein
MKLAVKIKEKSEGETKEMKEGFTKRKINTSKYPAGSKTAHVMPTHHPALLSSPSANRRHF